LADRELIAFLDAEFADLAGDRRGYGCNGFLVLEFENGLARQQMDRVSESLSPP